MKVEMGEEGWGMKVGGVEGGGVECGNGKGCGD